MGGLFDFPRTEIQPWEPEPLYLPLHDVPRRERRHRGGPMTTDDDLPDGHSEGHDSDLPGSHVIVIDLA
ncbi:MAG: hypothetical protein AAGC55_04690 [Myxococcota bacterium]